MPNVVSGGYTLIKTVANAYYLRISAATNTTTNFQIYKAAIQTPEGNLNISENGVKNVSQYETVTVNVPTGSTINNQNKTITPTVNQQSVTADSGYTGLGTVTVEGDADLLATNIKSGVNIFGVIGTLTSDQPLLSEMSNATGITANITTIEPPLALGVKNISTSGTYYASTDNYDGYSQVIVDAPIPTGTTVSKVVGEDQSISKGDFVT